MAQKHQNITVTPLSCIIDLSGFEGGFRFNLMVDLEDNWMKPPLPYPIWSFDREEKLLYIYDFDRYNKVVEQYYTEIE